jgi:SAM-dependent methyltransferase
VSRPDDLPREWFDRIDPGPDALFYASPRLVTHIDDTTIAALTAWYAAALPAGAALLDLMSSWVSHLPDRRFARVVGLGMNAGELAANPRLDAHVVHDLNEEPVLPFPDASFDAVLNAVSIQYLVRPVEVYAEVARVLRAGGVSIVAMSHRCFPTKAVRAFHVLPRDARLALVARYHEAAGGFERIELHDASPAAGDPLWIVTARRAGAPVADAGPPATRP